MVVAAAVAEDGVETLQQSSGRISAALMSLAVVAEMDCQFYWHEAMQCSDIVQQAMRRVDPCRVSSSVSASANENANVSASVN